MELTAQEWERVHTIARDLAIDVDRNELGKVVTYFRLHRDKTKFLMLIERLSRSNEYIRSRRTRVYFERILKVCREQLKEMNDERAMLAISWAFRMMTYYAVNTQRSRYHVS